MLIWTPFIQLFYTYNVLVQYCKFDSCWLGYVNIIIVYLLLLCIMYMRHCASCQSWSLSSSLLSSFCRGYLFVVFDILNRIKPVIGFLLLNQIVNLDKPVKKVYHRQIDNKPIFYFGSVEWNIHTMLRDILS